MKYGNKITENINISWKLGISGWKYFLPNFTWLFSDKFYHFTKLNHCKITFFDFLMRNVWFVWTLNLRNSFDFRTIFDWFLEMIIIKKNVSDIFMRLKWHSEPPIDFWMIFLWCSVIFTDFYWLSLIKQGFSMIHFCTGSTFLNIWYIDKLYHNNVKWSHDLF